MGNENDFFIEARRFEDQGQFDLAVEQYEHAIKSEIGDAAIAHQGKGRALARLGCFDEALEECQQALGLNPDLHLAHGVLGYIYFQQAEYDLAENEFLTALRLQPDDVVALNNLVSTYSNSGRYQEAAAMCEKAIQHQPENLDRRIHLAKLYLVQSCFRQAIKQLNRVVIAKPTMFRVFPFYAVALVNAVLQYFGRLNIFARLGALAGLYLVALLVPSAISVPIGIVLSVFVLLVITTNLWFHSCKYKEKGRTLFVFFAFGLYCVFYWVAVLLHHIHRAPSYISAL